MTTLMAVLTEIAADLIAIVGALAVCLGLTFCVAWLVRWIFRSLYWWQAFLEFLFVVGSRRDPELRDEWKRRKKAGWRFAIHYEPPTPATQVPGKEGT